MKKDSTEIRVIPQMTIRRNFISLIAEEAGDIFPRGGVVLTITPGTLAKMQRPLKVKIIKQSHSVSPILK